MDIEFIGSTTAILRENMISSGKLSNECLINKAHGTAVEFNKNVVSEICQ